MTHEYPQFWLAGGQPVKFEEVEGGGLRVSVFVQEIGRWLRDSRYRSLCLYDRSDWARRITLGEFNAVVIAQGGQP